MNAKWPLLIATLLTVGALCSLEALPCYATDINVAVKPVRILLVDYNDEIVSISSNTPQQVMPTIQKFGAPHAKVTYTRSLKSKYVRALQRYDFSKPTVIHIKRLSVWESIANYVINNSARTLF